MSKPRQVMRRNERNRESSRQRIRRQRRPNGGNGIARSDHSVPFSVRPNAPLPILDEARVVEAIVEKARVEEVELEEAELEDAKLRSVSVTSVQSSMSSAKHQMEVQVQVQELQVLNPIQRWTTKKICVLFVKMGAAFSSVKRLPADVLITSSAWGSKRFLAGRGAAPCTHVQFAGKLNQ